MLLYVTVGVRTSLSFRPPARCALRRHGAPCIDHRILQYQSLENNGGSSEILRSDDYTY